MSTRCRTTRSTTHDSTANLDYGLAKWPEHKKLLNNLLGMKYYEQSSRIHPQQ